MRLSLPLVVVATVLSLPLVVVVTAAMLIDEAKRSSSNSSISYSLYLLHIGVRYLSMRLSLPLSDAVVA